MTGRTLQAALAIAALALTACTGQHASTTAPSSTSPTPGAQQITDATRPGTTGQPDPSDANPATAHFLDVAHAAFPAEDTATLVAEGHAICAALRDDPSIHDAVGALGGRTQNQASANEVVRAAIAAYCPSTAAR
jgi:hypothetical protein